MCNCFTEKVIKFLCCSVMLKPFCVDNFVCWHIIWLWICLSILIPFCCTCTKNLIIFIYFRVEIFTYDFIYSNININFYLSKLLRVYDLILRVKFMKLPTSLSRIVSLITLLSPIYKSSTNLLIMIFQFCHLYYFQHFIIRKEKYWDWRLLLVHIHWWW